jgi:hypothetical protein
MSIPQGCYASAALRPVAGALADEDVADVAAGNHYSIARTVFGELLGWGANELGQVRNCLFYQFWTSVFLHSPLSRTAASYGKVYGCLHANCCKRSRRHAL